MKCRHCGVPLTHTFIDLGFTPPSNAYLTAAQLDQPEQYFPLKVKVCDKCWLVQTEDYAKADALFAADYAYFSSTSTTWLAHASAYSQMILQKLSLNHHSLVVEIAANDGYLLKNFVAAGIDCLGIEPTASTARAAEEIGIPVIQAFFCQRLAQQLLAQGKQADLIIGNNVYAHVPDINDFTRGLKTLLTTDGTITLEFPHLLRLIAECQFDTIYHEHFSYLSLHVVNRIFSQHGLQIYAVEQLTTHGGSLRIYGCHAGAKQPEASVQQMLQLEQERGLLTLTTYQCFQQRAELIKYELLRFLLDCKRDNKKVIAYGAAAKGNTLLNVAGIKPDLLPLVVDAAPSKQGNYLPGSHIPIMSPNILHNISLDYLLILPWNLAPEITKQLATMKESNTKFVTFIPKLTIN
ncbi:class I SAM-dependent methyltransferase [Aeromonas sp.]|uniref:class I SAM-dependent methyltransferase n=1 Tax=Aeromonas sp. TaxID=647 RepID=UPI00258E7D14|nr:class I SAM-dependent methyltransferase [Aeromonas sp.]MCX7132359.1 class I SAM-dependent methyltransferase [Aeromonas sp.]